MRRSISFLLGFVVVLSILLAACQPAATPTEPAQAQPENTMAPQPTNTTAAAPAAEPTATQAPAAEPIAAGAEDSLAVDPDQVEGNIISAGSSTVYPLSEAIVNLFESEGYTGQVTVDSIGSGAGIERFCKTGETDIANSSRAIKDTEIEACQAIDREPIEFRVGTDAMAVVVNPENDFLTNVTSEELAQIFSDQAVNWSDVNPDWPAEPIKRYTPGTDSGTYDYFIEAILQPAYEGDADKAKTAFQSAQNLQQSEDDNVLVQGIEGDPNGIGFFGFAYYQEEGARLNLLSVDDVTPDADTAESGTYPLARPLFIYSDAKIIAEKPQVGQFIAFYLDRVNEVITDVGYFPASDEALNAAKQALMDAMQK